VTGLSSTSLQARNGERGPSIELPPGFVETLARRVAAILAEHHEPEPDGFLDVAGAAEFLTCPTSRIYSLVSAKRIPHHKDGSRLLFHRHELRQFVRRGVPSARE
jgi:excisionase family DNA binding protein